MPARPFSAARRARRLLRPRARLLALVLVVLALATTACTGGSGASGGGSLSGGYVGGGASSRDNELASGRDGFDPVRPPSWDSASSASFDDFDAPGSGTRSGSTGSTGSTGSRSGGASSGSSASGSSGATTGSQTTGGSGGSSGSPQALTAASGNKVFVLGDSVLMAAETMLPTQLPGWDVTIDAKVSRRMDAGLGILQERRGQIGAVAVVHLCTNYAKGEGFAGKLDRALELLEGVPRIVLVTCVEWSAGQPEANAAIAAAAQQHPNVRIADWAKVARTPGYAGADAIHLLPPGVAAISKLIAEQIGPAPAMAGPSLPSPSLPTAPTMPSIPSFDPSPGDG